MDDDDAGMESSDENDTREWEEEEVAVDQGGLSESSARFEYSKQRGKH